MSEEQRVEGLIKAVQQMVYQHPRMHISIKNCFKDIWFRGWTRLLRPMKIDKIFNACVNIIPLVFHEFIARIKYKEF